MGKSGHWDVRFVKGREIHRGRGHTAARTQIRESIKIFVLVTCQKDVTHPEEHKVPHDVGLIQDRPAMIRKVEESTVPYGPKTESA